MMVDLTLSLARDPAFQTVDVENPTPVEVGGQSFLGPKRPRDYGPQVDPNHCIHIEIFGAKKFGGRRQTFWRVVGGRSEQAWGSKCIVLAKDSGVLRLPGSHSPCAWGYIPKGHISEADG